MIDLDALSNEVGDAVEKRLAAEPESSFLLLVARPGNKHRQTVCAAAGTMSEETAISLLEECQRQRRRRG